MSWLMGQGFQTGSRQSVSVQAVRWWVQGEFIEGSIDHQQSSGIGFDVLREMGGKRWDSNPGGTRYEAENQAETQFVKIGYDDEVWL